MELAQQEVIVGSKDHSSQITSKRKRTKRQRTDTSPLMLAMTSTTSSSAEAAASNGGGGGGGGDSYWRLQHPTAPSPTTSNELTVSTEEEEDMVANSLILLAQGQSLIKTSSQRNVSTTTTKEGGFYLYQCKTCDRCFPSFQALGGHRASHKKLKAAAINTEDTNKKASSLALILDQDEEHDHRYKNATNTTLSLQIIANNTVASNITRSNKLSKVHECSICGAEFSSGQALGGHMRRHRSFTSIQTTKTSIVTITTPHESRELKKPRNALSLDLNLPAPEDDHQRTESKFPFASKQVLAFSSSALVDCHY